MSTTTTDLTTSPAPERGSALLDPQIVGGPMRLADLVDGYWAITPTMHEEIRSIYDKHMRGEKIDISAVEARLGRPLNNQPRTYDIVEGVAIIPMEGVLSPKMNFMMRVSGGTSTQMLRNTILRASEDPMVKAGILYGDTPGGNVLMVAEAAAAWRQFASKKVGVTYSDGQLASAGYYIGSAGSRVFISGAMVNVGSIGVRTEVVDTTARDEKAGIRRTTIAAGKYKTAGDGPLSPEHQAYKQGQVDYLYTLFVDTVAMHLGTTSENVLENMADGRVFIGQQAIDAGLVHGYANLENLVQQLADNPHAVAPIRAPLDSRALRIPGVSASATLINIPFEAKATAGDAVAEDTSGVQAIDEPVPPVTTSTDAIEGTNMTDITRASLERDHPALFAELRSEFMAAGASAETARIQGVLQQSEPGQEALVNKLAFDGKTSPGEAAMQVNAARRQQTAAQAQAHFNDAPPAAPASAAAATDAPPAPEQTAAAEKKAGIVAKLNPLNVYARYNGRTTDKSGEGSAS